ncbi:MAG: methyltransferase domain-containing protein, partial [Bacteroidota bacterium]
ILGHIAENFPQVSHLVWVVNQKLNSSFSDLPFHIWKGETYMKERLGNADFMISPVSFFQTNPQQAKVLYDVVRNMLTDCLPEGRTTHHVVYDLYAGTGSIGIYVADLAEKIVGIEYVTEAIEDAKKNVALNQLEHFSFYAGDMRKILTDDLMSREGQPDVVIADPPRNGMDAKVVAQLLKAKPQYIIYVSCKASTQARDIDLMREAYEVVSIQPVDMFPHTAHVENVAFLKRKD